MAKPKIIVNEKALQKALKPVIADATEDAQRRIDQVYDKYNGRPAAEIEQALRRALAKTSIQPDRAQLRTWAQHISDGQRVTFTNR